MRAWICVLALSGCATLRGFADEAERVREETAALVMALDAVLDECEELQEPKPAICAEADRLRVAIEPYVPLVEDGGGEGVP